MRYNYRVLGILALVVIGHIVWMGWLTWPLHFECKQTEQALLALELFPEECSEGLGKINNQDSVERLLSSLKVDDRFAIAYSLLFAGIGILLSQTVSGRCTFFVVGALLVITAAVAGIFDSLENQQLSMLLQSASTPLGDASLREFKKTIFPYVLMKWLFVFVSLLLISFLFFFHKRWVKHFGWLFLSASVVGLIAVASSTGYFSTGSKLGDLYEWANKLMGAGLLFLTPLLLACPQAFENPRNSKKHHSWREESETVTRAKLILRGRYEKPAEILQIAKMLMREKQFGYARKLLRRARADDSIPIDPKLKIELGQKQALCTYKDPDLPTDLKLQRALKILNDIENLNQTNDEETLGLAGSIYKRRWELNSNREELERSLRFYSRGAEASMDKDKGWNRINKAYVQDLLAAEEAKVLGANSKSVLDRISEAKKAREEVIQELPDVTIKETWLLGRWWYYTTLAEAYFGLGQFDLAKQWIKEGLKLPDTPDWEKESTARQFASLRRLQLASSSVNESTKSLAEEVLKAITGNDVAAVESAIRGKVGLALSGGGFRAALYHIGVLAKLAEVDLLRSVEVLSCVSGGSIVGAQYYLELKKLMEEKSDDKIKVDDYIEIVRRLEEHFVAGVQTNVRTRVLLNPLKTFRMMFSNYSRTVRVGELMEKKIFSLASRKSGDSAKTRNEFWINDLWVVPKGEEPDFNPKTHDWRRCAKVPIIVFNATTLNTGHNWHFSTTYMGEPPASINSEIDANYRLRRIYYDEAPEEYRRIRLGTAVGASAAVPGVFEPIVFPNLYPDITVALADGGVQDNQGIGALLEQDCSILLVSDASGQMEAINQPASSIFPVLLRSNLVLQARVRDLEFKELEAKEQSSRLKRVMFIHLKKGLDSDPIDFIGSQDRYVASEGARPAAQRGAHTRYGILKDIQRSLAAIRTDLDSFSEAEAHALMVSGYRMTEFCLPKDIGQAEPADAIKKKTWSFLRIEPPMVNSSNAGYPYLKKLLDTGSKSGFKIWYLSCGLRVFTALFAIAALAYSMFKIYQNWSTPISLSTTVGGITWWFLMALLVAAIGFVLDLLLGRLGKDFIMAVDIRSTLRRILFAVGGAFIGWFVAIIHLAFFDPWFLKRGKVDAVLNGKYHNC